MTTKDRIEAYAKEHRLTLVQASNRGRRVWALQCAMHAAGVHRYTLTNGVACRDWAPTLAELEAAITPKSLTAAEAAASLGIAQRVVTLQAAAGRFPGARKTAGGAWLIPEAAVEVYRAEVLGQVGKYERKPSV